MMSNMMNMMGSMGMMGMMDPSAMMGGMGAMCSMGCGAGDNGGMAGMLGANGGATGMEIISAVLQMVPERVASETRGFSLRCAVPDSLIFSLQGQNGQITQEIERTAGVRIQVSRQVSDSAHRALSVTGPLFGVVAAYIRLMKRYLEVEGERSAYPALPAPPPRRSGNNSQGGPGLGPKAPPAPPPRQGVVSQLEKELQHGMEQIERLQKEMGQSRR